MFSPVKVLTLVHVYGCRLGLVVRLWYLGDPECKDYNCVDPDLFHVGMRCEVTDRAVEVFILLPYLNFKSTYIFQVPVL